MDVEHNGKSIVLRMSQAMAVWSGCYFACVACTCLNNCTYVCRWNHCMLLFIVALRRRISCRALGSGPRRRQTSVPKLQVEYIRGGVRN